MKRTWLLAAGFVAAAPVRLMACPMCAELIERARESAGSWRFAEGVAWSMLIMLPMPFLLAGSLTFFVWKRSRARRELHGTA